MCEGTKEAKKYKKHILLSPYEAFMANLKEEITDVLKDSTN